MSIVYNAYARDNLTVEQKIQLQALLVKSYRQYEPNYTDPQVWNNYLKDIRASVDHPHIEQFFFAQDEEGIIGSVSLFKGATNAYNRPELQLESYIIRFLAVDPTKRGHKIAENLVESSLQFIQANGGSELVLHTSDKMQSAIKLYERMGFNRATKYDYHVGDNHVKSFSIAIENLK